MEWYFAENGRQQGPATEEQFVLMVREGRIGAGTLVWHEGLEDWRPYGELAEAPVEETPPLQAPPSVAAPAAELEGDAAVCASCRRRLAKDDMLPFREHWICVDCKPAFFQRLREGARGDQLTAPWRGGMSRPANILFDSDVTPVAGFWIRAAAKIVDGAILGGTFAALFFASFFFAFAGPGNRIGLEVVFVLAAYALAIAIPMAYTTFCLGRWGATPGKMLCGLRVVGKNREKISYLRAFGRFWAELLSAQILYIGYLIAVFDARRRTLHDHLCSTLVVPKHAAAEAPRNG